MIEVIGFDDGSEPTLNLVAKVPVPRSTSSGIWMSAETISGLPPNCWCFIGGTFNPPQEGDPNQPAAAKKD